MTLNHDDPRLTAYVLGELDDEGRRAVEAEIGHSPQVRQAVEEIRRTADLLARELAAEPCPAVDHDDHVDLQSAAAAAAADAGQFKPMRKPRKQGSRAWLGWTAAAMAASVTLVLLLPSFIMHGSSTAPMRDPAIPSSELLAQADSETAERSGGGQQSLPAAQAASGTPGRQPAVEGKAAQTVVGDFAAAQAPVPNKPPLHKGPLVLYSALRDPEGGEVSTKNEPTIEHSVRRSRLGKRDSERRLNANELFERQDAGRPYQVFGQPSSSPPGARGLGSRSQMRPATRFADIAEGNTQTFSMGEGYIEIVDGRVQRIAVDDVRRLIESTVTPESWTGHNTEAYDSIIENPFQLVTQNPLSTFSIDVDTASYANVRRFLNQNTLPPPGAVRIEELVNYFRYDYAGPEGDAPFATHAEVTECPWQPEHHLVRIGLKGREIEKEARPPSNLVFLLDVSGSMRDHNKLPLVKQGMRMLIEQLTENDRVAIVVYAGASGLILDSMPGDQKESILASIDRLEAGGSTNGASGIQLAYQTAVANFLDEGTNRVILATDGDFNVGTTDQSQLVELIEEKAKSGVFLTVLGFGMGNLKDSTLEKLADKGNGNYAYIDTEREARKVLVEELSGTLITIAKDVKIQIEFNPAKVAAYRLIGYENRLLAKEDFNDDTKDAGEIGAGHTVTALYEIVPAGKDVKLPGVDDLEYQVPARLSEAALESADLLTLKLRYKEPDGDTSKLLKFPVADAETRIGQASDDFQFAAAVAAFGMILRGSQYRGNVSLDAVQEMAQAGIGADEEGYRSEFIALVNKAKTLVPSQPSGDTSQQESESR